MQVYAIKTVKDPKTSEEYGPVEAERRGLINKIQGIYMDPATGEKMSIREAIQREFIIAAIVEEPDYDDLPPDDAGIYATLETRKVNSPTLFDVFFQNNFGNLTLFVKITYLSIIVLHLLLSKSCQ